MKRHYVFAITAPVFWSLAGVVVKSLEQATEWQINFYRCLSLTLFVAAVTLIRYRRSTLAVLRMGGLKTIISGALLSGAMLCNVVALDCALESPGPETVPGSQDAASIGVRASTCSKLHFG